MFEYLVQCADLMENTILHDGDSISSWSHLDAWRPELATVVNDIPRVRTNVEVLGAGHLPIATAKF